MNRHSARDTLAILTAARELGRGVFFSESIDSPGIESMLDSVTVHVPEICGEGCYEVMADTPCGELDPAFCIPKWLGVGYPTLIWHHGSNEKPFDFEAKAKNAFNSIIGPEKRYPEANIIVLRAPFHACELEEYAEIAVHLRNLVTMLAVSVKLAEHLAAYAKGLTGERIIFSGISLGGFVANLHRTFYNSADSYVPLLAGATLSDLFLSGKYKRLTSKLALENPENIRKALNFEDDFMKAPDKNVFPLLAEYDRFLPLSTQSGCYEGHPLETIKRGHITAALSGELLREHVMRVLIANSPPGPLS